MGLPVHNPETTMSIWRFPPWVAKNWYFFILDVLLNAFLITPLTISLWVSTWELIYNLVRVIATKEEHLMRAFAITLVFGSLIVFATYLLQHFLKPCVTTATSSPAFLAIFIRAEMYFSFMARMVVWVSLYEIIGESVLGSALSLIIGLVGLACLRSLNSGVSTPMNLQLDCQQQPCNQDTRFMINPNDNEGSRKQKCLYVLDALVTSLVIEYLIIASWRGAFNILDIYMLPNDPKISAWVTVIIGYNMFWIYTILQFPASQISKQLSSSPWKQIIWELICWLYAFIMMVCLWRGFWNLITIYSGLKKVREPYNFVLSLVMHVISVLVTLGLNVFVNGRIPSFHVADGALRDGSGIMIKNYLKNVSNMMAAYIAEDASETTTLLNSNSKDLKTPGNIEDKAQNHELTERPTQEQADIDEKPSTDSNEKSIPE